MEVSLHLAGVTIRAEGFSTIWADSPTLWRASRPVKPEMPVRTTDKPKRNGYNNPPGNSRLPVLAILCCAVLLFLASCGGQEPEPPVDTPIPQAPTETPAPDSNDASGSVAYPSTGADHGT